MRCCIISWRFFSARRPQAPCGCAHERGFSVCFEKYLINVSSSSSDICCKHRVRDAKKKLLMICGSHDRMLISITNSFGKEKSATVERCWENNLQDVRLLVVLCDTFCAV